MIKCIIVPGVDKHIATLFSTKLRDGFIYRGKEIDEWPYVKTIHSSEMRTILKEIEKVCIADRAEVISVSKN